MYIQYFLFRTYIFFLFFFVLKPVNQSEMTI